MVHLTHVFAFLLLSTFVLCSINNKEDVLAHRDSLDRVLNIRSHYRIHYISEKELKIHDVIFNKLSHVFGNGGAIYICDSGNVSIYHCSFIMCKSWRGGGIYGSNIASNISNVLFMACGAINGGDSMFIVNNRESMLIYQHSSISRSYHERKVDFEGFIGSKQSSILLNNQNYSLNLFFSCSIIKLQCFETEFAFCLFYNNTLSLLFDKSELESLVINSIFYNNSAILNGKNEDFPVIVSTYWVYIYDSQFFVPSKNIYHGDVVINSCKIIEFSEKNCYVHCQVNQSLVFDDQSGMNKIIIKEVEPIKTPFRTYPPDRTPFQTYPPEKTPFRSIPSENTDSEYYEVDPTRSLIPPSRSSVISRTPSPSEYETDSEYYEVDPTRSLIPPSRSNILSRTPSYSSYISYTKYSPNFTASHEDPISPETHTIFTSIYSTSPTTYQPETISSFTSLYSQSETLTFSTPPPTLPQSPSPTIQSFSLSQSQIVIYSSVAALSVISVIISAIASRKRLSAKSSSSHPINYAS